MFSLHEVGLIINFLATHLIKRSSSCISEYEIYIWNIRSEYLQFHKSVNICCHKAFRKTIKHNMLYHHGKCLSRLI